jgi:hypothetical protein
MACSAGIGDLDELVGRHRLGVLVNDPDDAEALGAALASLLMTSDRERIAGIARTHLARDAFLPVYRQIYAELAEG